MDEILVKDYEQARDTADSIQKIADKIMNIFNTIDTYMTELYGETWQSNGADVSNGRYRELKANYEEFYSKISEMQKHINQVTSSDQTTDAQVGASLS